jgi:DNA replication protein DnaC
MTPTDTVKPALSILLQSLRLPHMTRQWQELESRALREGWSHGQFLLALCEEEKNGRSASRVERYLKESVLPDSKSLTNFDFRCCPTVDEGIVRRLASDTGWLERGENLLLFGPSGVGKTHLAAAIARALMEAGARVKFTTATVLVQQLQQAKAELVLPAFLSKLERYELLVVDDIGYVKKSEVETSVLFELISHRYEMKSLLITANQTFSEWDSIFADATMTVAAVDRLVHHATIIEIRQESFRKKTALSRPNCREPDSPK